MKVWLLLLLFRALVGQGQPLRPSRQVVTDTAELGEVARCGRHVQLPALSTLLDQRHVRFFTAGSVLDCWQSPVGVYQGQVVQWVREVVPAKERETKREFMLTQLVSPFVVQALFAVLDSSQLLQLPDERAISGWNRNILDGVAYTVEYRDAHTHRVATYSNPASQGSLPEAQLVLHVMQRLDGLSQLQKLSQLFGRAIPYQCWTNDSGSTACRVVTLTQQVAYKRDRQRYRRQQAQQAVHPLPDKP